jgi:predicted dehydrogenase
MADFGCHRIEVLLDLLGPIARARGFAANVRFMDREVEDTCTAHLDFRSGAQAVVTVTHAASERRDCLSIFGTEGSAHVDELNLGLLRIVSPHGVDEESHSPHANLHQPLVEDFLAAIGENREPAVTGRIGLEVARVIEAIYGR